LHESRREKIVYGTVQGKLFISIMVIIAGVIASVVAFMMPPWYKATVNIVPPNNPGGALGGMLGGMTSALKDIGLSKLGGKSESYTYLTVLESRSFKDSLIHEFKLHEEYDLPDTNMKAIRDVFKENLEVELTSEGNYNISITSKRPENLDGPLKNRNAILNYREREYRRCLKR
jgi:LPS O-antigen subunit length determinant protein (WzzB/FepE family)